MNTNNAAATMDGSIIGRVMVRNVVQELAPEMREASSKDGSIFSIALLMVMNAYG